MNKNELIPAIADLKKFIGPSQLNTMCDALRGEEKEWFAEKIIEVHDIVTAMPKTYETDGQCDRATVHLHYFRGNMDWYITEKDMTHDQIQAFGLADLGYYPEIGYINIKELIGNNVELDLHWTPKSIGEVKTEYAV